MSLNFKLFFLTGVLSCGSLTTLTFAQTFSDVAGNSAIDFLVEKQIITGYPDGTFKPNQRVKRAEALAIVLRSAGISPQTKQSKNFSDVAPQAWFFDYVATGVAKGIVRGNPDGSFAPEREVNTAEFLTMLLHNVDLSKHQNLPKSIAPDVPVGIWFAPVLSYAETLGLVLPDNQRNLNPGQVLTRGAVAEITYRFLIIKIGGEAQKLLKLAEVKLLELFLNLSEDKIEAALLNAENAVDYTTKAVKLAATDKTARGAQKIAEALQSLTLGYVAKQKSQTLILQNRVATARSLAAKALAEDQGLKQLTDKIEILAADLLKIR